MQNNGKREKNKIKIKIFHVKTMQREKNMYIYTGLLL